MCTPDFCTRREETTITQPVGRERSRDSFSSDDSRSFSPTTYIYIYVERTQDKPSLRRVEKGKTRVVEIPSHVSRITSV